MLSLVFKNKTSYFDPKVSATAVRVSDPSAFSTSRSKIEGYELRLYYEFLYTQKSGGQTFFYTFTYNDNAVPSYMGQNCFDYKHLEYLLNGGLKKTLFRKYGIRLKYFVGAELGDGKGKRGMSNNPHYHILFFLSPDPARNVIFSKIPPLEFRSLCRKYWQNFDESKSGFIPYQLAKFGICREGDNFGLVTDYRACVYCAKYVLKDNRLKVLERKIIEKFKDLPFEDFHQKLNEFRNRYSNKCRISNGVGLYALEHVKDLNNPLVPFPKKNGFIMRSLPLYLYRKLFYDVCKNENNNAVYVLNEKGQEYKINHLQERVDMICEKNLVNLGGLNQDIFNDLGSSAASFVSYESFLTQLERYDIEEVSFRYALYKSIYEFRYYEKARFKFERYAPDSDAYRISPIADYVSFITPTFGKVAFDSYACDNFLAKCPENFESYRFHPFFCRYLVYFDLFDSLADYFDKNADKLAKEKDYKIKAVRRFHISNQLNF